MPTSTYRVEGYSLYKQAKEGLETRTSDDFAREPRLRGQQGVGQPKYTYLPRVQAVKWNPDAPFISGRRDN